MIIYLLEEKNEYVIDFSEALLYENEIITIPL